MSFTVLRYRMNGLWSYTIIQASKAYRSNKLLHLLGRSTTDRKLPPGLPHLDTVGVY